MAANGVEPHMQIVSRNDDFDVDLNERRVIHRPSGIAFSFYAYATEADWLASDTATMRDNLDFDGDRGDLAAAAQRAAVAKGMTARQP